MAALGHIIWGSVESPSLNSSSTDATSVSTENGTGALRTSLEGVKFKDSSSSAKSPEPSASPSPRVGDALETYRGLASSSGSSHKAKRVLIVSGAHECAAQLVPAPTAEVSERGGGNMEGGGNEEDGVGHRVPTAQPLLDAAELWSKGSEPHSSGKCRPCHYVHTSGGCLNGRNCTFCHLPHTGKSRPRPSKTKRLLCKNIVNMLDEVTSQDSSKFTEVAKAVSCQSSYMRGILRKRMKQKAGKSAGSTAADGNPSDDQLPQASKVMVSL
mmetsp:Transcript_96441/g.300932  ORF Transcript_96441/g.300932 Transcript_96441/m.300932 type:complete len:270 (-) Transcript_96441:178-987(-)